MKYVLITLVLYISLVCMSNETHAQNFWQGTDGPWLSINYAMYACANGELYVANDSGVYRTTNRGDHWELLMHRAELPMAVGVAVNASGHIFAASVGHYVLRSTDGGTTWTEHSQGIDHKTFHCLMIDNNGYLFVGTDSGIFRSTDNAENWTEANTGVTNIIVTSMAVTKNNTLYAGTTTMGAYMSTDNGSTWGRSSWINAWFYSLAVSPTGVVYGGKKSGGIYRTTDNGQNWELLASAISKTVYGLAVNSHGDVFAGTEQTSVFRSTDSGATWSWIYTGMLYNQTVRSMAVDSNDYVYAGASGNGVYRSILPTTAVNEPEGDIPLVFSLSQNFPNPFNPSTVIRYQLPGRSYVSLNVYNMLGQEVATLVDGIQDAGFKDAVWNAGGLPSGVYYYTLIAGMYSDVKRMLVIK